MEEAVHHARLVPNPLGGLDLVHALDAKLVHTLCREHQAVLNVLIITLPLVMPLILACLSCIVLPLTLPTLMIFWPILVFRP